jgi:hypothetical protein
MDFSHDGMAGNGSLSGSVEVKNAGRLRMALTNETPAGLTSVPGPNAPSSGALPGLLERAKRILLAPKTEWPVIEAELTTPAQLYTGYVMPLAAFAAVISLVHMSIIGVSLPFSGTIRVPFTSGMTTAVLTFGFGLVGLFLVALIINGLVSYFGGTHDQRQALKVAAYAFTPTWLATVFSLLPTMSTLLQLAAAMYGIYLLALGLPVLMKSPKDRASGYTATVVLSTILLCVAFGIISAAVGGFSRVSPYGAFGHESVQERAQPD